MVETKQSLLKIADELGVDHERFLSVWEPLDDAACRGEITSAKLWEECTQQLSIASDYGELTPERVRGFKIISEVHTLATQLTHICKVGILSNMYADFFPIVLSMGLIPNLAYQAVILSCEEYVIKPDPFIYKVAEMESRVKPNQLVLLDDKQANIDVALESGWEGVLFDIQNPRVSVNDILELVV